MAGLLAPLGAAQSFTPEYACTADSILQSTNTNSHQGWAVDGEGNWTLSGSKDLLTGSGGKWEGLTQSAGTYNFAELHTFPLSSNCGPTPVFSIRGEDKGDRFAHSLAFVGDIDLDGKEDFVVCAPRAPMISPLPASPIKQGFERGRAYVFLSSDLCLDTALAGPNPTASDASLILEMPDQVVTSTGTLSTDGFRFGYAVAPAGDFDGDGEQDIAISAPGGSEQSSSTGWGGRVYVFSGADLRTHWESITASDPLCTDPAFLASKRISIETGGVAWQNTIRVDPLVDQYGVPAQARYGHSLAYGGTAMGVGTESLLIGAPQFEQNTGGGLGLDHVAFGAGFVDVVKAPGTSSPTFFSYRRIYGERCGSEFGYDVDGAADLNGDRRSEVLVGAPYWNATLPAWSPGATCSIIDTSTYRAEGRAYVFDLSGPPVYSIPPTAYFPSIRVHDQPAGSTSPTGVMGEGRYGMHVGFVGRLTADRRDEYVVGSPLFWAATDAQACEFGTCTIPQEMDDEGGGPQAGAAYVYDGADPTDTVFLAYYGEDARDGMGWDSARIGNVDGMPRADLLISAPRWGNKTPSLPEVGRIYLFLNP